MRKYRQKPVSHQQFAEDLAGRLEKTFDIGEAVLIREKRPEY